MLTSLGTLAFLATFWLLAALATKAFQESGAKIIAALKGGHAPLPSRDIQMHMRIRSPQRASIPAQPRWRVAA